MLYRLLADAVLLVHALFVAFVVLGGLWVCFRPKLAWPHLPAAAWAAGIELTGGICPLTPLENHFRMLAGAGGFPGGFVEHYLLSVLYPDGLTRGAQIALGLLVLALNTVLYVVAWRRARRRGQLRQPAV